MSSKQPDDGDAEEIRRAVQLTVGREVLRRLKRLSEEEAALEQQKARWATRILSVIFLAAVLAIAWIVIR